MKNILITGTGRSGTSLVTGILNNSGYYSGNNLYPPRVESNPTGFFENHEINGINETILAHYDGVSKPWYKKTVKRYSSPFNPKYGQRWLALLSPSIKIESPSKEIEDRIKKLMHNKPFAYKDPRFVYTFDVWKNFLPSDTFVLVVFRDPFSTIQSMHKEINTAEYLTEFNTSYCQLEKIWLNNYSRLYKYSKIEKTNFLFFNYTNLILNPEESILRLEEFVGTKLNTTLLEKSLFHQTEQKISLSRKTQRLFTILKESAINQQ
ncbi:MAG: hypothetical protein EOL88_00905 [Bacteroidia bacterium]|nr:hypothetical protein [Bacteroidia bacterium]